MYLSRFGVKNYKCLGDIDIPLTPIHVLIGENDSGKTSLLEAIQSFLNSFIHSNPFPQPWSGLDLINHSSDSHTIDLYGQWDNQNVSEEKHSSNLKCGCRWKFSESEPDFQHENDWVEINGQKIVKDIETGDVTNISNPEVKISSDLVSKQYVKIIRIKKTIAKYNLHANLMSYPSVSDPKRLFRLDTDGFGLPNLLNDISSDNPERFIDLRNKFCNYFPQFTSVRTRTSEGVRRRYNDRDGILSISTDDNGMGIFFETKSGKIVRAEQASDGAILFLGFLALSYVPEPPNLLLIEEPENGIYPKRLEQLITLLKDLVHRTEGVRFPQIVMTTHSPYLLSYFEPEEVTFFSRPKNDPSGPVRARPLRDAPNIRERLYGGDYYLGELWYNLSEEDLFGAE